MENANKKIYEEVNSKIQETTDRINKDRKRLKKKPKKVEKIVTFAEFYTQMNFKRIENTITSKADIHEITFESALRPRIPSGRKPGRPKFKCAEKGIIEYWEKIRKQFKYTSLGEYDPNNELIKVMSPRQPKSQKW